MTPPGHHRDVVEISAPLRRELLPYLLPTSSERAELLAQL
jgi:hypothetical protein